MSDPTCFRSHFWLAPQLRRQAQQVYAQQMWAWGQDIRAEGNLLRQYGFEVQRSLSSQTGGSSQYRFALRKDLSLILWSFGLSLVSDRQEALILARHSFRPRLVEQTLPEILDRPTAWPQGRAAQTMQEAQKMTDWLQCFCLAVAAYEDWIRLHLGLRYRQSVMQRWPERCRIPASEMGATWQHLGQKLAPIPRLKLVT